jgi:tetratricopeptide (TPR) repeat protein
MYLLATVAGVVLTAMLVLEGVSIFERSEHRPHVTWFGGFTLFIAVPVAVLQMLFLSGSLVYGPEFGIVLVEGTRARIALEIVLVGAAAGAGLLWHVARLFRRPASRRWPIAAAMIVVAALSLWSVQGYADPDASQTFAYYDVWWPPLIVWIVICVSQCFWVLIGVSSASGRAVLTSVMVGAVAERVLDRPEFVHADSRETWLAVLGAAAITAFALVLWQLLRSVWRWRETLDRPRQLRAWLARVRTLRLRVLARIAVMVALVLALGRLVRLQVVSPSLALSALVLAWIVLAEAFAGEPLVAMSRWEVVREMRDAESPLRSGVRFLWNRGLSTAKAALVWLRDSIRPTSYPSALLKALIGLVVLVALSDLPNAGRTIVYPFDPGDLGEQSQVAQVFPTWLVREIAALQGELAPLMISIGTEKTNSALLVSAAPATNAVDAALAKTNDLEFSGVKIPLNLFVAPIQSPVRRALGARVITGTLHSDRSTYVALATSSRGESWRADVGAKDGNGALRPVDALNELARRLAFEIVKGSIPVSAGMTQSWNAFEEFRHGLLHWDEYERGGDWDALPEAIESFRNAVRRDRGFSLAHYRLGVALYADAQPAAAIQAFAAATQANPMFAPADVARAYTLSDFERHQAQFVTVAGAGGAGADGADKESSAYRRHEAQRLWRHIVALESAAVSPADRASSYLGLCRDISDHAPGEMPASYLAYFYCRRAEDLYARMDAADPQVVTTHASVLNQLGVILRRMGGPLVPQEESEQETEWHCSIGSFHMSDVRDGRIARRDIHRGPYTADALQYYQRALARNATDPVIRCNAAAAAYAMGDRTPMRALDATAQAHLQLGAEIASLASGWYAAEAHQLAVAEYTKALRKDPTDVEAMNNYAYEYWQWERDAAATSVEQPDEAIAINAESFAREAVRRSGLKGDGGPRPEELRSTLGEVLLGRGRPHEAIDELTGAAAAAPAHTRFDEIRWDLVQAYRCAADQDAGVPERRLERERYETRAAELLAKIEENDRTRETPQFGDRREFDLARRSVACATARPAVPRARCFALRRQIPKAQPPCAWLGVTAQFADATPDDTKGLRLRVWGGGVDEVIDMAGGQPENVFLSSRPRATHEFYFARLEDEERRPVSASESVDTYDGCSRNLISLEFAPARRLRPQPPCFGDCGADGQVTIDDLLVMVNIALGAADPAWCRRGDVNGDEQVSVDEMLGAVNATLTECTVR